MGRRFFEGFEQGVPGSGGEHVNFVDDIDFVFAASWGVEDIIADFSDIVNAVI